VFDCSKHRTHLAQAPNAGGAQLHQKALTISPGTARPASRTIPQADRAWLSGVSFSNLLGSELLRGVKLKDFVDRLSAFTHPSELKKVAQHDIGL